MNCFTKNELPYSSVRCSYCGYRFTREDDNAGAWEKRGDDIYLHPGCAPRWDQEYAKESNLEAWSEQ